MFELYHCSRIITKVPAFNPSPIHRSIRVFYSALTRCVQRNVMNGTAGHIAFQSF